MRSMIIHRQIDKAATAAFEALREVVAGSDRHHVISGVAHRHDQPGMVVIKAPRRISGNDDRSSHCSSLSIQIAESSTERARSRATHQCGSADSVILETRLR